MGTIVDDPFAIPEVQQPEKQVVDDPFSIPESPRSVDTSAKIIVDDPFAIPETSSPQSLPDVGRSDGTENIFERGLRDTGVAVAKTVVGTGEALVGLSDLLVAPVHALSGGRVPLPSQGYREMGYNPELTQQFLDSLYSKATLEAKQRVSEADGFKAKVKTAMTNPSTIVSSVGESVGPMLLGGGAARTMVTKAAMNPALAAALGEALITAGGNVSQITQSNEDHGITGKQAAVATGSAALTGLISLASGRLQGKLGIDDIDVLVAGGRKAASQSLRNPAVKLALSTFFEGAVEELPQSVQEQISNNIAQEKPWDDGVDEAAAMGLLSGMAMGLGGGGGGMLLNRGQTAQDGAGQPNAQSPAAQPAQPVVPVADEIKAFLDQRAAPVGAEVSGQGSDVSGQRTEDGGQPSSPLASPRQGMTEAGQPLPQQPTTDNQQPISLPPEQPAVSFPAESPASAEQAAKPAPEAPASPPVASSSDNIYMRMPIERVQADAQLGNVKAIEALAARQAETGRPTPEEARPPSAPTGETGQPQIADVINREVNDERAIEQTAVAGAGEDQAGNGSPVNENASPAGTGIPAARWSTGQEVVFQRKRYVNRDGKWFNTKGGNAVRRADLVKQINQQGRRILTADEKAINADQTAERKRRNAMAQAVLDGDATYQRFLGEVGPQLLIAPPKMERRGQITGKFKGHPEEYKAIPQRFRSPRGMQLDDAAAGLGMDGEQLREYLIGLEDRIQKAQDSGVAPDKVVDAQVDRDAFEAFDVLVSQGIMPDRTLREEFPDLWKEYVKLSRVNVGGLRAEPSPVSDADMEAFMALTEDLAERAAMEDAAAAEEVGRQRTEDRGQPVAPAGEMFADVPFNLMGDAPVEQAPVKPTTPDTPALFSNRELMGRAYDDLDNKGISDLQIQARRESVDLTNVPNSAPRIREAIREARRTAPPHNAVAQEIQAGADDIFGSGAVNESSQLDLWGQQELPLRHEQAQTALKNIGVEPTEQNIERLQAQLATISRAARADGIAGRVAQPAERGGSLRDRLKAHVHRKAFDVVRASLTRDITEQERLILREATKRGVSLSSILAENFDGEKTFWPVTGAKVSNAADVAALAMQLRSPYKESIKVLSLDAKNRVISGQIVSVGTLNSSLFHPREVFKVPSGTSKVVIVHNHPSGDPNPSAEDVKITQRAIAASRVLGLEVLDHIITNGKTFFSFNESGALDFSPSKNDAIANPIPAGLSKLEYTPQSFEPTQAVWELIPTEDRPKMTDPADVGRLAVALRETNPNAAHVVLMDTKNKISGIYQFEMSGDKLDVVAMVRSAVGHGAGYSAVVSIPRAVSPAMVRQVRGALDSLSIQAMDIIFSHEGYADPSVGTPVPWVSAREIGMMVSETGPAKSGDAVYEASEEYLGRVQKLYEAAQAETDPVKLEAIRTEFRQIKALAEQVNGQTAPAASLNTPEKRKELAAMSREELQSEAKARGLSPVGTVDVIRQRIQNAQDGERVRARSFLQTVQNETGLPRELLERLAAVDPQTYQQSRTTDIFREFRVWLDGGADRVTQADAYVRSKDAPSAAKGAMFAALLDKYQSEDNFTAEQELVEAFDTQLRESGRFIQASSLFASMSGKGFMKSVDKFLAKYKVSVAEDILESIRQDYIAATRINDEAARMDAVAAVIERVASLAPTKWNDWMAAYRYTNMLSNPRSHERNVWGNFFQTFVARPLALAGQGRLVGAVQYNAAAFKALPNAIQAFKDAWASGSTGNRWYEAMNSNMSKFESERMRQGAQAVPARKLLLVVGRALEAQDKFFGAMIAQGETYRLVQKGVSPEVAVAAGNKMSDDLLYRAQLGADMGDKTKALGVRALDAAGYSLEQLRKTPFIGKPVGWFVPFIRTPINVGKRMVEFSPLGVLRAPGAGKMTAEQAGRAAAGSAVMLAGAMLALAGQTTGAPPKDKEERRLWYASGRRPWSVLLGGKWIPMWYFGSFAGALAMPAAIRDSWVDDPTTSNAAVHRKVMAIAASMSAFYGSQTPFDGVGKFLDLAMGRSDYTTATSLAFNAGQFIPASGFLRWANQLMIDPVYRRGGSFEEGFKKDYPFFSQQTRPLLGPEIRSPSGRIVLEAAQPVTRKTGSTLLPYDVDTVNPKWDTLRQSRNSEMKDRSRNNEMVDADIRAAIKGDAFPDQIIGAIKRMPGGTAAKREERSRLIQRAKSKFKDAGLEVR